LGADSGVNQITAKKYVTIWRESLIGFLLSPGCLSRRLYGLRGKYLRHPGLGLLLKNRKTVAGSVRPPRFGRNDNYSCGKGADLEGENSASART